MLRVWQRLAAAGLAAVAMATATTPALGACAGPSAATLARVDVAFVGTLTAVRLDGSVATFEIEEVWRGDELPAAGPSPEVFSALGMFEMPPAGVPAVRFLVLARHEDGHLRTGDDCDAYPFPWDPAYAAVRPADARSAAPAAVGVPWQLLAVLGASGLIVAVSVLAFRRRQGDRDA
jgi:hypothetical protein